MLWFLSYASETGPRGAIIVEAPDFLSACARSIQLALSPGGEVYGADIPEEERERWLPYVDCHVSYEAQKRIDSTTKTIAEHEANARRSS